MSERKGSNCGTERKTKYNSGRERQGEGTEIEIGGSTEGVEGFTLTRRHKLGLSFNIMHRRVRTYNHIRMKRYRYAFSRYIHNFISCTLSQINKTLAFISSSPCFLLHTSTRKWVENDHKLHVGPGGAEVWLNTVRLEAAERRGSLRRN